MSGSKRNIWIDKISIDVSAVWMEGDDRQQTVLGPSRGPNIRCQFSSPAAKVSWRCEGSDFAVIDRECDIGRPYITEPWGY